MSKIITVAMQKGGVGKTTTTVNLGAALAERGLKVLIADLDPQGNLTQHVGYEPSDLTTTIYQAFKDEINGTPSDVTQCIYETDEGFHILPSQPEMSLIEMSLINTLSREQVLRTILEPVGNYYDYILIDCSPSLGLLVINALTAADSVIIPVQTEYLAARGANMILSSIETIRRRNLNPALRIEGILLTMADTRTILTRDVLTAVRSGFGSENRVFDTIIKRSVRFGESAAAGESILAYDPQGPGAEAYRSVAKELLNG
jgi:chromosome partitioning protein